MKTLLTYMKASDNSGVGERKHRVIALVGRALCSFFVTRDKTAARNRLLYGREISTRGWKKYLLRGGYQLRKTSITDLSSEKVINPRSTHTSSIHQTSHEHRDIQ